MGFKDLAFSANFGKKSLKGKLSKKNIWITKIYNKIIQCDIIFPLLAPLCRNRKKTLKKNFQTKILITKLYNKY